MSTVRALFLKGQSRLQKLPQIQPLSEARILLCKCASLSDEEFFIHPDREVPKRAEARYFRLIARRLSGCPLPFLTGIKEFWSIPFHIPSGIFIPRPETEVLVEKVLELSSRGEEIIIDIGTGSGNIAVSLARELPGARIYATDISRRALKAAEFNAGQQNVSSIIFLSGSRFSPLKNLPLKGRCDFVVSNPPYVSEKEWEKLDPGIKKFEPKRALVPGKTGLECISRLIEESLPFLKPGAYLVLEVGQGQAGKILPLFDSRWQEIQTVKDLRGIPRVIVGRKAGMPIA
ncbi:MAG: peptide chain release factor N(5)-glutamine methyltransferase [Candidatus Aminicenantales bacterium]